MTTNPSQPQPRFARRVSLAIQQVLGQHIPGGRQLLEELGFQVTEFAAEIPSAVDVAIVSSELDLTADWPGRTDVRRAPLIVSLGEWRQADVQLPGDVTVRELQIALPLIRQLAVLRTECGDSLDLTQQYAEMALQDTLTGIANRRAWDAQLQRLAGESVLDFCLVVLDVDDFKQINDGQGHSVGDAVLQQIGQRLQASVRSGDFVARYGGDEFAILLRGVSQQHAAKVVDRMRQQAVQETPVPVTMSAGFTAGTTWDPNAFDRADAALRAAKANGKNRSAGASQAE